MSVVRRAEAAVQPWRNGGGTTRELARWPLEGDFVWRLSVADVRADGPFSEFPGVDRILTLLSGDGMTLHFTDDGSVVRLDRPLDLLRFAGERPVTAELHGGATTDLNLMWRRDLLTVSSAVLATEDLATLHGAPDATVVLVVGEGTATLPSGEVLGVGDAVVSTGGTLPAVTGSGVLVCFVLRP